MGETEDELEEKEEIAESKGTKINIRSVNSLLIELVRLLVVILVVVLVSYFMINRKMEDNLIKNLKVLDVEANPEFSVNRPVGEEWALEEMLVNTADEFANHFVKTKIILSYTEESTRLELTARQSQIYSEVRKVIGAQKYIDLKSIRRQEEVAREIKNKIQQLLGAAEPIGVILKEFTVY